MEGLPSLWSLLLAPVVCDPIGRAHQRDDFRFVHVCILSTHVHLICEASGAEGLTRGMRSRSGILAQSLNSALARRGKVIAERYHAHVLRTRTEVRHAVQYVLRNAERHGVHDARTEWASVSLPDPLTTAWFTFWQEPQLELPPRQVPASLVRPAETYLMTLEFRDAPLSFTTSMCRVGKVCSTGGERGLAAPDCGPVRSREGPAPNRVR